MSSLFFFYSSFIPPPSQLLPLWAHFIPSLAYSLFTRLLSCQPSFFYLLHMLMIYLFLVSISLRIKTHLFRATGLLCSMPYWFILSLLKNTKSALISSLSSFLLPSLYQSLVLCTQFVLLAGFLLSWLSDPENGRCTFFWYVGGLLPNYMVLQPRTAITRLLFIRTGYCGIACTLNKLYNIVSSCYARWRLNSQQKT